MKRVYFFGTGNCAEMYADKIEITLKSLGDYKIMGFLDNDVNKVGMFFGKYKIKTMVFFFPNHTLLVNF